MRFLAGLLLASLALAASGCGQAGSPASGASSTHGTSTTTTGAGGAGGGGAGTPLKVMTWNVHNFFDDQKNSPGKQETLVSTAAYEQHLAIVGKVIHALDPDVVVMQEVEHPGVLADLGSKELAAAYPAQALFEGNDPRGLDIGAISKIPFDATASHKDDQFDLVGTQTRYSYARDCLELHLTVAGRPVVLLGVHFRSKGGDVAVDDPDKRLAEAQHTRAIADGITAKDPTAALLLLGDFNDDVGSQAQIAAIGKSPAYTDVAALPQGAWSYSYQGARSLIDHQIASPLLAGGLGADAVTIVHDSDVQQASDHAPVMVTYAVR
jgi:predicted extracellular nuclease